MQDKEDEDLLYHYTKLSTALKILEKMELRLSPLKKLKDPREYRLLKFNLTGNISDKLNPLEYFTINEEINDILKSHIKVACFCQSKLINEGTNNYLLKGSTRSRMWTQYSGNHTGICLAFSKKNIEKYIKELINPIALFQDKIDYKACTYIDNSIMTLDYGQYIKDKNYLFNYICRYYKDLLFTKNIDYIGENEYRIAYYDSNSSYSFINIQDSIRGIILGDRFYERNKRYIPLIKEYVKKNNLFCEKQGCESGDLFTLPVDFLLK